MAMLPSYASALNPIDATAQAIGEVGYAPMVELVRQSERIDTILLISSLANEDRGQKDGRRAGADHRNARQADPNGDLHDGTPAAIATLARAGIACYTSMPSCARAIEALVDYGAFRRAARPRRAAEPPPRRCAATRSRARSSLPGAVLTEHGSKALLARYGCRCRPKRWPKARPAPSLRPRKLAARSR